MHHKHHLHLFAKTLTLAAPLLACKHDSPQRPLRRRVFTHSIKQRIPTDLTCGYSRCHSLSASPVDLQQGLTDDDPMIQHIPEHFGAQDPLHWTSVPAGPRPIPYLL